MHSFVFLFVLNYNSFFIVFIVLIVHGFGCSEGRLEDPQTRMQARGRGGGGGGGGGRGLGAQIRIGPFFFCISVWSYCDHR
jgi:hypothetical protein